MGRLLAFWVLVLVILTTPLALSEPFTLEKQGSAHFLTSTHAAGITLFDDHTSNLTDAWTNGFRCYRQLSVYVVGFVNYSLEFKGSNYSVTGSTNRSLTALDFSFNETVKSIWPILTIENETFNFGIITIQSQPVEVVVRPQLSVISITEYLRREWLTLVRGGIAFMAVSVALFFWVSRYKRGTIHEW